MTLLKVIKNGVPVYKIKEDTFLKKYIKQYFNQFSKTISEEKEISKRNIQKVINLITLIEPIPIKDKKSHSTNCFYGEYIRRRC